MLHNHLLRHDGWDTVGDELSDWTKASLEDDDSRISHGAHGGGGAHALQLLPHQVVDDDAVGNETTIEVEESHAHLRDALVEHYMEEWADQNIMWMKPGLRSLRFLDSRPLEAGGAPPHQSGHHCRWSDGESSIGDVEDDEENFNEVEESGDDDSDF